MTTIRITDSEFDLALAPERKLSRVPPGHWRCVFRITDPREFTRPGAAKCGCVYHPNHEVTDCQRSVTREIADEVGRKMAHGCAWIVYVRAEFFPGERP